MSQSGRQQSVILDNCQWQLAYTAFSYQVNYNIVAGIQQVSVVGQALPDLQNALFVPTQILA